MFTDAVHAALAFGLVLFVFEEFQLEMDACYRSAQLVGDGLQ